MPSSSFTASDAARHSSSYQTKNIFRLINGLDFFMPFLIIPDIQQDQYQQIKNPRLIKNQGFIFYAGKTGTLTYALGSTDTNDLLFCFFLKTTFPSTSA